MNSALHKLSFGAIALFSLLIGLYPSTYFLVDRKFGLLSSKSEALLADLFWNIGFYGHIMFGGLALLVGWAQFIKKIRNKRPVLHRNIGKVYVFSVLISSICGIYIAHYATGGLTASLGFILLGLVWFYTTLNAYLFARKGDIVRHEKLMIFSFAACFAAVTLRIWLPMLSSIMGGFVPAYRVVAWLCWVPNLLVAYIIVRNKQP